MKVKVTQRNIDKGQRHIGMHCPVALALLKATGRTWKVSRYYAFELCGDGNNVKHSLPAHASYFIKDFDAGRAVVPFDFEIAWRAEEK